MATDATVGPPVRNEKPQQLSKGVLVACMTDALALAAQRKALGRLRLVRLVTFNDNDRLLLTDALSHSLSGRSAIENALNVEAEMWREAERRRKESSADEKRWRDIELDRTTSTSAAVEAAIIKLASPVMSLFGDIAVAVNNATRSGNRYPSDWEPMN